MGLEGSNLEPHCPEPEPRALPNCTHRTGCLTCSIHSNMKIMCPLFQSWGNGAIKGTHSIKLFPFSRLPSLRPVRPTVSCWTSLTEHKFKEKVKNVKTEPTEH